MLNGSVHMLGISPQNKLSQYPTTWPHSINYITSEALSFRPGNTQKLKTAKKIPKHTTQTANYNVNPLRKHNTHTDKTPSANAVILL